MPKIIVDHSNFQYQIFTGDNFEKAIQDKCRELAADSAKKEAEESKAEHRAMYKQLSPQQRSDWWYLKKINYKQIYTNLQQTLDEQTLLNIYFEQRTEDIISEEAQRHILIESPKFVECRRALRKSDQREIEEKPPAEQQVLRARFDTSFEQRVKESFKAQLSTEERYRQQAESEISKDGAKTTAINSALKYKATEECDKLVEELIQREANQLAEKKGKEITQNAGKLHALRQHAKKEILDSCGKRFLAQLGRNPDVQTFKVTNYHVVKGYPVTDVDYQFTGLPIHEHEDSSTPTYVGLLKVSETILDEALKVALQSDRPGNENTNYLLATCKKEAITGTIQPDAEEYFTNADKNLEDYEGGQQYTFSLNFSTLFFRMSGLEIKNLMETPLPDHLVWHQQQDLELLEKYRIELLAIKASEQHDLKSYRDQLRALIKHEKETLNQLHSLPDVKRSAKDLGDIALIEKKIQNCQEKLEGVENKISEHKWLRIMHERERQCQQLTRDLNDGLMNIEDYTTAIEGITQQIKTGYLQASDSLQNPERAIQLRQQAGTVALNMQNATNTVIARVRNRYGGFNSLTAYRAAEKAQQQRQEGLKKRKGIINIQLSTVGIKQELQFQFADSQEYSTFYKKLAEEVNFLGNCSTRGTTYSLTINTNNFFCGNLITITLESSPESSIVIQAQHFGFIGFLYERLGLQNLGVTSHKNEWTNSAGKPRSASILTFSASLTNILRSGQPIKLPYQMFSQFDETEEVVAAAFRPPVPPLPRQNQLAITSNYTGLFPAAAHSKQKEEDPTEGFFVALSKKTSKTGHKRQPSADEQAKAKRPGSFNSTTF